MMYVPSYMQYVYDMWPHMYVIIIIKIPATGTCRQSLNCLKLALPVSATSRCFQNELEIGMYITANCNNTYDSYRRMQWLILPGIHTLAHLQNKISFVIKIFQVTDIFVLFL